ncbi:hypothetical protein TSUD_37230 [Trifolium subterraneum]|uniref:Rx N-terminal domain-containing protein n=1 Tax=Trifolium subterraneum TaxID=3900 RepID=A0A2Z6LIJ2_TRISU|nr:hypothetical protein TSUD_37230 [Trifolium subterraneum]
MTDVTGFLLGVTSVANSLSNILIEEYTVLGSGTARQVAWIERELRSMQGLLERMGHRRYGEKEQELNEWEEKFKEIAGDAEDVIETFVIKSVKRRRWGVLYWIDKHKLGKELEKIRKRMRDISQTGMNLNTDIVGVSVETTPGGEATSSSNIVVVAMEMLDHIMSQTTLVTGEEVIEMVERVKGELVRLQNNIVSNLWSISERKNVWLEEVRELCNYTERVVGKFILVKERRSKMGRLKKIIYLSADYASENEFKKKMKYIRTRIGDAVHKSLTYGVGGQLVDMGVGLQKTTPVPDLPLESYCMESEEDDEMEGKGNKTVSSRLDFRFIAWSVNLRRSMDNNLKSMQRFLSTVIYFPPSLMFRSHPILSTFLFILSYSLTEVIAWSGNLRRSMDKNLKCTQRYLALIHVFLSDTTESAEGLNKRQRVWVGQVRAVSQNGQSLIDAYQKGKGDCLSRMKFAKDINCLLKEILDISDRKAIYGIANIQTTQQELVPLLGIQESGIENEMIVQHDENSGATQAAAASFSYRPVTGLKEKVQSIRGAKELMDALLLDAQEMGELDGRSRIWVEQLKEIGKEAAKQIAVEEEILSTDYILETLARAKYLIVVDGIKETSQVYLDTLSRVIPDMSTGSRVLFTTRNANVAQHAADPKMSIIRRVADHLDKNDIWNNHIHGEKSDSTSLPTNYKDVLSFLSFDTREGSKPGQQVGNFLKGCISSDCFLLLRVLDLERVYKPKLPNHIARLSRLRYLGLRWTYLESLPSSISKLLKLQTLDLKHTYIHTLPTSIWKMELRHLFLSETYRTKFPPQPKGNSLSDLQTLWGLFVDEESPVKDGLDRLVNITKLGLACQSMSLNQEEMIAQLETVADWITTLEYLQSLRLKSRDEEGQPWILHLKSFEKNVNLTDMYLLGSLNGSSLSLSQFPSSLIELTLSHSKLQDDPMKLLKDFPNLRTLCLLADSYVGTTIVCESQSFPRLQLLKFWVLEQLEEWTVEPGALPCLRQMEIRSCPRLILFPDGLKHVDTLLELKLTNMPMDIIAEVHNIPPNCQVVQTNFQ